MGAWLRTFKPPETEAEKEAKAAKRAEKKAKKKDKKAKGEEDVKSE